MEEFDRKGVMFTSCMAFVGPNGKAFVLSLLGTGALLHGLYEPKLAWADFVMEWVDEYSEGTSLADGLWGIFKLKERAMERGGKPKRDVQRYFNGGSSISVKLTAINFLDRLAFDVSLSIIRSEGRRNWVS